MFFSASRRTSSFVSSEKKDKTQAQKKDGPERQTYFSLSQLAGYQHADNTHTLNSCLPAPTFLEKRQDRY